MIGNHGADAVEPEQGKFGQQFPLARYDTRQDHVESRHPVGCDDEPVRIVDDIDIAHLAAILQFKRLDGARMQTLR